MAKKSPKPVIMARRYLYGEGTPIYAATKAELLRSAKRRRAQADALIKMAEEEETRANSAPTKRGSQWLTPPCT